MLIHSLELTNFKKYNELQIDDIPEEGVIKVGGKNESGKTSIGDAVCFALFGRTLFTEPKNTKRLIRWGEKELTVSLVLQDDDEEHFKIIRTVNDNGLSSIRIEKLSDNEVITTVLEGSDEIIYDMLGYDYETYADSFSVMQRELTTPKAKSNSIKQMAGIADYGKMVDELGLEVDEENQAINVLQPRLTEKQGELDAIDLDESWLPDLVDAKESLYTNQTDKKQLIGQLGELNANYAESKIQYKAASKRFGLFELLGAFLLPLMIGAWLVWGLFQFFPKTVESWLPESTTGMHAEMFISWVQNWMFPIAMACVLFYGISLFFKWRAEANLVSLKQQAEGNASVLIQSRRQALSDVHSAVPVRVAQKILQSRKENETVELDVPPTEKFAYLPDFIDATRQYAVSKTQLNDSVFELQETLYQQNEEIDQHLAGVEVDIDVEKQRSDKAGRLRSGIQKLAQDTQRHEYTVKVKQASIGLIQRASSKAIQEFNQSITAFAETALPYFTDDRYSKLRINDDLSVEVYSDEKQSYMAYDEISSGTQRQIMLAMRIGMSEQLARNTGNKKQFIFLDEPFAFFDHQRTVATLEALPTVSDVVTQIWVTSQEFPEELVLRD